MGMKLRRVAAWVVVHIQASGNIRAQAVPVAQGVAGAGVDLNGHAPLVASRERV